MSSLNSVTIIGRLGADPQSDTSKNGTAYCRFSVATDRINDEEVDWHHVTVFGASAEACAKYLHKGALVAVQGQIRYTKKDDKFYAGIIARQVEFLVTSKEEQQKSHTSKAPQKKGKPAPQPDDDVPF